jgi:hypothetical protein
MFTGGESVDLALRALAEHSAALTAEHFELLVCGGSALLAHGLVVRTTRDVDVLAVLERTEQGAMTAHSADPLPRPLVEAADRVARDFGLTETWLNPGPTAIRRFGLPVGLVERAERREYGQNLAVWFVGRHDQVFLKLDAASDPGGDRHLQDLRSLSPTKQELREASRWCLGTDRSGEKLDALRTVLVSMGHSDVAQEL